MNAQSHVVTTALVGALLLLMLQGLLQVPETFKFSRTAYEHGAFWQLLTSQVVHLNWPHAAVNALVLALSLICWQVWIGLSQQMIALVGGMVGVALVLALDADCAYYAGLSGALHGLWAGNAVMHMAMGMSPFVTGMPTTRYPFFIKPQYIGLSVLLMLAIKLFAENAAALQAAVSWLDLLIYRPAHWAGLAGGIGLVSAVLVFSRLAAKRSQGKQRQRQHSKQVPKAK